MQFRPILSKYIAYSDQKFRLILTETKRNLLDVAKNEWVNKILKGF